METKGTFLGPDQLAEERRALQSVLESPIFKKNPRLTSLLEHICEKYFQGEADSIKEYSIAADVFRRPETFDQTTDSIVRVEFYRLRRKLREFYETIGADQPIEIVIATGRYLPEFVKRVPDQPAADPSHAETAELVPEQTDNVPPPQIASAARNNLIARYAMMAAVCLLFVVFLWFNWPHRASVNNLSSPASTAVPALPPGPEVRILCGYSRPIFKDQNGNVWMGDRYFSGGFATELPNQHIDRTRTPQLYLTLRSGTFSYNIPLKPGTYEMRLHFAETTYSPASTLGGGENSRVFDVKLNGRPLLTQFDIVSDAGANTADVRVFKDVHPGPDGKLRLDFSGILGLPMINAIEIVPGLPHRLRPIRMVAQNSFVVDKAGNLWSPDTYFSGGQLAADKIDIGGTDDPGLYGGERYGNFSFALPVDQGTYALTLYFAEKYWGTNISKKGGTGSRVFDVLCNGIALARNMDIAKEVGPGRAYKRIFHGLHPNAQGKLLVSLVPDVNYASVDAVEVEEEEP
jgi:hypothetical protein